MKKYIGIFVLILLLFTSYSFPAVELDTDSDGYIDIGYMPLDQLWTFGAGLTISTGQHFTLGTTQWDNGSDAIDGERIADDTIDDDSIDFTDVTISDFGITSTTTQLNYLNAATGTTGTTSTNIVFSTSPTLVTPALGTIASGDGNALTNLDGENIADDTIDDDSIDFDDVTLADLTDDVGYEEETHASRHNDGGADEIDRGTENVTQVTLPTDDSTPDILNNGTGGVVRRFKTNNSSISAGSFSTGETYIITLVGTTDFTAIGASSNTVGVIFTATGAGSGTGTADIVITDLDDGTGAGSGDATANHSSFGQGIWTVIGCYDSNTTFKFDSNSKLYRQGPDLNFSCLSTNPFELYFRYDSGNDRFICDNLPAGLTNPTTMAISKASFSYDIKEPENKTYDDDDDLDQTVGTDLLRSDINVTGDNDSDGDSIDLQDCPSGFDGQRLTFRTYANVDENDPFTVDVETDSTCIGCSYGGIYTMYNTGCVLTLRCEYGVGWHLIDFYHPPTSWEASTTLNGIDNLGASSYLEFSASRADVSVRYRWVGQEAGQNVNFTVPYTSKDRDTDEYVLFYNNGYNGTGASPKGAINGIGGITENSTTVHLMPSATWNLTNAWDTDSDETRSCQGQFTYQAN